MTTVITSSQNERVKTWKKLLSAKGRKAQQKYLLEGWHLVQEGLKANRVLECFMTQDNYDNYAQHITVPITIVTDEIVQLLAETKTSQAIFGVATLQYDKTIHPTGKYILLDALQDPGNVGTIIRTADAAGYSGVIVGNDTVDIYNAKTVRSMQGSQFHIPILKMPLETAIQQMQQKDYTVYATALDKNAQSLLTIPPTQSIGIVVGNEGNGVSATILNAVNQTVYIPMPGQAESLNVSVAAGIVMYHFIKEAHE